MLNLIINFFKKIFGKTKNVKNEILKDEKKYNMDKKVSEIKILLDNGHGITTRGKRSPYSMNKVEPCIEFYEYQWNREIAREIHKRLINLGYNSDLIVPEDNNAPLSERVKIVNQYCDELGKDKVIVISIHSNAKGNGKKWENAQGWEAYTNIGETESDKLSSIFYKNAEMLFEGRKIRYDWTDKDADKEMNYYILKYTKCPAILTENFFYDNIDDVQFILSKEGREKIIQLHLNSIIEYLETK